MSFHESWTALVYSASRLQNGRKFTKEFPWPEVRDARVRFLKFSRFELLYRLGGGRANRLPLAVTYASIHHIVERCLRVTWDWPCIVPTISEMIARELDAQVVALRPGYGFQTITDERQGWNTESLYPSSAIVHLRARIENRNCGFSFNETSLALRVTDYLDKGKLSTRTLFMELYHGSFDLNGFYLRQKECLEEGIYLLNSRHIFTPNFALTINELLFYY